VKQGILRTEWVFSLCVLVAWAMGVHAEGIHYTPPVIEQFHALGEEPALPSILSPDHPPLLECKTTLFEDREIIDFEKREISFERAEKNLNIVVWQYRYDELDSYLASRTRFGLRNAWYKNSLSLLSAPAETKKNMFSALQWELPVQYPDWAKRILGKDPPRLSISGYEKIIVSYENSKTDLPNSNVETRPNNGLVFDQENQFSITGSVGRLINLNIKGSTKQVDNIDDPLKNFKIEYKGEGDELEDEVIQEVAAGYTSFNMPNTILSGYSESHEGLFGIKVNSKVGPLALTGIASMEQGEAQKTMLYPSGTGEASTMISEKDFKRNKIFFLDTIYLNHYLGLRDSVPKVTKLQVWRTNEGIVRESQPTNTSRLPDDVYRSVGSKRQVFKLLKEHRDYFVQPEQGWIRFDSLPVEEADELGICLETSDTSVLKKGADYFDTTRAGFDPKVDSLWILKPRDQDSTNTATFPLMWRNVYDLPSGFDPQKFRIRVVRVPDTTQSKSGLKFFSEILGLTDDKGNPLTNNTQIYDIDHKLIILPVKFTGKNGVRGNEPFSNDELGEENVNRSIYRENTTTSATWRDIVAKYQISMSGSSRKTTFTLGFGSVMEGTEVLRVGDQKGSKLERGKDYIIDYQMGQVDLISKSAQSADKISAEFQSEALFMPKRKVFFGGRGEVKLPIGDKSFIGTSVLYQDAASREAVPKINQEPYSKLLLDMNTQIDLEPEWMTKAVNLLPFISTEAKSSVSLEVEVAHSRTNPNTSSGKDAYIDDFEGSKETYPLGLSQGSWYMASPPSPYESRDSLPYHPPAWLQYWYAPLGDSQVIRTDIWDTITDQKNQTQADKYEPTLNFVCQPSPSDTLYRDRFDNPWAGIMTYFPAGTSNREKDKYLEFWAKNTGGGRLYIDLGAVSEDLSLDGGPPNGVLDLEDKNNTGIRADSINIGLDGKRDTAEIYRVPNAARTGWDTLRYWKWDAAANDWFKDKTGARVLEPNLPYPGDPGKDNYKTYSITQGDQKNNFPYVNGTEKDDILNTEDLNSDGFRTTESYFRRYIDFDRRNDAPFLAANANNYQVPGEISNENRKNVEPKWHLYRIPLNDTVNGLWSKRGSPKWNEIKYIRLWWSDFGATSKTRKNKIQFARMQFVGNQWVEVPVVNRDSTQEIKLSVSTINTEENSKAYTPPDGVSREHDDRGNLARETSLDLPFRNLLAGNEALVKRSLSYQPLNLSSYDNLSVMVHGDADRSQTGFWYFFRFGTDDSTYYESRIQVHAGWQKMVIRLREISDFKLSLQEQFGDTVALRQSRQYGGTIISIRAPRGRSPSFSNVTWMAMGVVRDSSSSGGAFAGDLWIDEMKVSGIKELNGWAGRVYLTTKWADFMNFSLGVDYEDGSFRRMTETQMGLDNSLLSANMSLDWDLDKFLPEKWGINLPLGTRLSESLTRPQIKPNSDIYLSLPGGGSDGIAEMYQDALNMVVGRPWFGKGPPTDSKRYQTTSFQQDWWTGFDKKTSSKNPFVNLTLERTALDFSSSLKVSQAGKGSEDRLDIDSVHSYHGTLKYNLTPSLEPKYYKFKPFEKSKLLWLPDRIKNYEFSYLPTTLTFDVAEATYSRQTSIRGDTRDTVHSKKLELDHRTNLAFDPVNILNLQYNLSISRNLDESVTQMSLDKQWWAFLSSKVVQMDPAWGRFGILYGERSRTQAASLRFDPSFLDWLSHSFDYSANYTQSANTRTGDPVSYQNLGVAGTFHLSSTLTLASLFKNLADGLSNFKAMAAVFNSIEAGINAIAFNNVTFDYSGKSTVRNDYMDAAYLGDQRGITGWKFFKYQLGLSGRRNAWDVVTGDMDDREFGGMLFRPRTAAGLDQNDQRSSDMNYSLSTSFNLPEPIDISFSGITLRWSKNFVVRPDTSTMDRTTTFPDFSVSARTGLLNKIPFVKQQMQSVQMSSSYSFLEKQHESGTATDRDRTVSVAHKLSPAVGLDGTLKTWPVNLNYSWNWGWSNEESSRSKNFTESVDNSHKIGLKYEISKSGGVNELKIFMWTLPIKGRVITGAEAEYGTTVSKTKTATGEATKSVDAMRLELTPHASYDFTDNITGQFSYTASRKKDINQTTTSHIFQLTVEIRFNP
jgi:hypothetical protein